ncbi:MAG: DUF4199 domain-containing protein [Pseudomonadota bacterium]
MFRYALVYGGISGLIVIASVVGGMLLGDADTDWSVLEWLGYLIMLVALSLIFVGVRRYRDEVGNGAISYWQALAVGLSISAVAGVIYVAVWEVYLFQTDYTFINDYSDGLIAREMASGASPEALAEFTRQVEADKDRYGNPLFRLGITFLEIFPVGLLISLISAAFLRRAPQAGPAASTTV